MAAIPDFAAGAMENWGLVTYREARLLVDKETSSSVHKESVISVIAHEFAHMWFGNLGIVLTHFHYLKPLLKNNIYFFLLTISNDGLVERHLVE